MYVFGVCWRYRAALCSVLWSRVVIDHRHPPPTTAM
jgi:hypothetical protein